MTVNGKALLEAAPIKDMLTIKERAHGVSYGLSEAGYDIRLKQDIIFNTRTAVPLITISETSNEGNLVIHDEHVQSGTRFTIASAMEEFQMPPDLVGIVHDKSTWARQGLSVFNTVIEPGFKGGLTLELVYHGAGKLHLPAGCGIAQVIFSQIAEPASYNGKYQNQSTDPTHSIFES